MSHYQVKHGYLLILSGSRKFISWWACCRFYNYSVTAQRKCRLDGDCFSLKIATLVKRYSISILVWTNFSIHYQSNDRFLYIPHKTHNAIILCILRKIKSKKGIRGKHDDVGGTMNMICKEIKFLLLQIDWIKVILLDSNICKKSHKSIQCLSFLYFLLPLLLYVFGVRLMLKF